MPIPASGAVLRVGELPGSPLDAAAEFHRDWLAQARTHMAQGDLVIVLPTAPHDHHGWRLAVVQELAREAAPLRVNAIAGTEEAAIAETLAYRPAAPDGTGQLLAVAGNVGKMD